MRTFQILFLFLMLLLVACSTSPLEEFVVGKNFIKDQTGIVKIDTLTLQSSIIKYDSIISSSSGRFLVGSNYNYFSGYKSANSYLTMKFDDAIEDTKFVFDSLCLVLNYDTYTSNGKTYTYFSGDTTVMQTIGVYQLQEQMELKDGYLYTTSNFKYNPIPLGTKKLKPEPKSGEEVSIRLSDKLGNRLAQMIKDKRDTITSPDLFIEFFNGIVIKAQPDVKGAIIGFRTSDSSTSTSNTSTTESTAKTKPEMRLYYHLSPNPNDVHDLFYKFSFATGGIYFNQISGNSASSLIDGIENTNNERISKLTNDQVIAQSGIQVFTKLKIPYIDNLLKASKNSAVVGAILKLYPVKGTYNKISDLPDSLYVYKANRNNQMVGQITLPGESTKYAYGILTADDDVEGAIYYLADISAFIEAEVAEVTETNNSLFIGYGSSMAKKTAGHVILGGINSGKYSPDLSVFYYHN